MGVIFDIGCSVGLWIEANYNTEDRFIGVEPHPEAFKAAQRRFKGKDNVEIINFIASDTDAGVVDFHICREGQGEVSTASMEWVNRSRHDATWDKIIQCTPITIEQMVLLYGEPSYIKIDVEGYELNVLMGMIKKRCPLSFEYAEELKDELIESVIYLEGLGYDEFYMQHADEYTFRPDEYINYNDIINLINTLIPERKQSWGMLHAK